MRMPFLTLYSTQIQGTYEYLSDEACREDYERQVVAIYGTIRERLTRCYNDLHETREKIQAEVPHNNAGTDASQQSRGPDPNMVREQKLLEVINNLTRFMLNLNREMRVVPNPFAGNDLCLRMAQQYESDRASWEQTVRHQTGELHLADMVMTNLEGTVDDLSFEIGNQKELVRLKTAKVDNLKKEMHSLRQKAAEAEDLKKETKALRDEICKEKQRSGRIQNHALVLYQKSLMETKDLKETVKRQQEKLDELKKMETELEVKRNTQRNLQMVREARQQSHGGVNDAIMTFRSSIETTRAGQRPREFKRTMEGSPEESGASNLATKRFRANEYVDPGLSTPPMSLQNSVRPSGGPSLAYCGNVAPAQSAAIIRKQPDPEPR